MCKGKSYQFKALPFGLSTVSLEFTNVVKEVKLIAQGGGIRIHQYLDNWLVRAKSPSACHQTTQTLVTQMGWIVNMEKSELVPQQIFDFVGYRYDLSSGKVCPTQHRWEALTCKV